MNQYSPARRALFGYTQTVRQSARNSKPSLEFLRAGDTLVVTRIDRLARSAVDLLNIVEGLKKRGVNFKTTEQPFDTSKPEGDLMITILAAVAQFGARLKRERQMEGIAKAKERGVYQGRPAKINQDEIGKLRAEGLGPTEIAEKLGIGRTTVYRAIGEVT
jgi:DNA invertase Pin-like site-specific DNA recombinase